MHEFTYYAITLLIITHFHYRLFSVILYDYCHCIIDAYDIDWDTPLADDTLADIIIDAIIFHYLLLRHIIDYCPDGQLMTLLFSSLAFIIFATGHFILFSFHLISRRDGH